MSVASEITRLQNAKAALKTAINAKNDSSHQIDDETLEDYAGFVDLIHDALPAEYTELEYIESNGTQWINTGFVPTQDDLRVIIDVSVTENGDFLVYGIQGTSPRLSLNIYNQTTAYIRYRNANNSYAVTSGRHVYENGPVPKIDGVTQATPSYDSTTFVGNTKKIALFGIANAADPTDANYKVKAKVYDYSVYYGNTLMQHLVPAKRNSDNVIGMYDKVSGTFFTNAGTGEFIAPAGTITTLTTKTITENGTYDASDDSADGYSEITVNVHEALPFGYKELEYLESSGTQCIDTDIPLKTATDDVEVDFYVGSLETPSSIFGARYSTSSRAYSFGVTSSSQWRPSFGSTTENTGTATVGRHVAFMSHNGGILKIDDIQIINIGNASITTPDGCYVFAIKGNGSNIYYSTCRIYSFKIWRSGELLMHLVPAQRLSDLEAGMYDMVNGTFFTNSGTGEFIIPSGQSFSVATKTITTNGIYNASDDNVHGYSQIDINVQAESVQPEVAPQSDVNFYDYDGTIVYSYTAAEFAQLTEMPANPTHAGLISQGWNWTLADAKTQVTAVGACDIGQMYVTDDGKTRLYCHVEDALKSFYFGIAPNGTVVIDWGDESNTDTVTGTSNTTLVNTQHTYSKGGDYVITISVTSGNFSFYSTTSGYHLFCYTTSNATTAARPFLAFLRKVELGTNARLGQCAFTYCTNLETITIPKTIDSISTRIFEGCYSLRHITFPKRDGTLFSSIQSYFTKYCYSLKSFSIPTGITNFSTQSFYATFSLYRLILPTTVTTISNSALINNYALSKLVLPSGVTSIETQAFSGCYGMREYHFKSTTPPTLDNVDAFTNIRSACVIYVPSASLNDYKTASNWSTYASQMVGE